MRERRSAADSAGRYWLLATWVTALTPIRASSSASGFAVIDNTMRARFPYPFLAFRTRGGADNRHTGEPLASWVSIEPTPPAARRRSAAVARVAAFLRQDGGTVAPMRRDGGGAAARRRRRYYPTNAGLRATMRVRLTETRCCCLDGPARRRTTLHRRPAANRVTALPTALTTPTASQPSTRGVSALKPARTFSIHRVDGNGLHFNQRIMPLGNRLRQLDVG